MLLPPRDYEICALVRSERIALLVPAARRARCGLDVPRGPRLPHPRAQLPARLEELVALVSRGHVAGRGRDGAGPWSCWRTWRRKYSVMGDSTRIRIDPALGDRRYRAWMWNAFERPTQRVLKCLLDDAVVGFFVVEAPQPGHCFWSLTGLARTAGAAVSASASGTHCYVTIRPRRAHGQYQHLFP